MSEIKQMHTSGALRAAQRVMRELRNDARSPMAYSLADAISRETGDLGMLEALEQIQSMIESTYCTPAAKDDPIWQEATKALRKARGEE